MHLCTILLSILVKAVKRIRGGAQHKRYQSFPPPIAMSNLKKLDRTHKRGSGDLTEMLYFHLSREKKLFDRNAENVLWLHTFFSTTPLTLAKT